MKLEVKFEGYNGFEENVEVDTNRPGGFNLNEIMPVGMGIKSWYIREVA